mgnify:CR=1 FL=1
MNIFWHMQRIYLAYRFFKNLHQRLLMLIDKLMRMGVDAVTDFSRRTEKTACAVIDQLCFSRLLRQMEPKYCLFTIMEKKHVGLWAKTASRNKLKQELSYGRKGFATVLKVGNHIRANMHRMFPHVHTRVYGQIYRQCDKLRLSLKRYFRHQIYLILLSRQNLLNDFCR